MTAIDGLEKGLGALKSIFGAIQKFKDAKGDDDQSPDPKMIMSGILDIANALAEFVPPPASLITGTISGIFDLFMPKKPSTEDIIKNEFAELKEVIATQTDTIISAFSKLEYVLRYCKQCYVFLNLCMVLMKTILMCFRRRN